MNKPQVYEGLHYDGEWLISSDAETAIRRAINKASTCRADPPCPHCDALVDDVLPVIGANLYAVYG